METFNISEFETNQVNGTYEQVLRDGTKIIRYGDSLEYVELLIPSQGWFYSFKGFYGNGSIKITGERFKKGDYPSGIWRNFDKKGTLESELNYDLNYNLTIDSVLTILKNNKIPFSLEDHYNKITRGLSGNKYTWFVCWKTLPGRIEIIDIDDVSGKILKQYYRPYDN
jgi:hypothetical protein